MPTWTFECEMHTDEQRRQAHAFLAALREDPNVAHIDCHDDNPLSPHVMRVEVSCADGISSRTVEILRVLGAVGVPAVPANPDLYSARTQAQLLSRGYLSLHAPLQISHIRPQGAAIRTVSTPTRTSDLFTQLAAQRAAAEAPERQRLDQEARAQLRAGHHDDQVDAFSAAFGAVHTPFTRRPLEGFSRIQDPDFHREFQGTFRSEEADSPPVTLEGIQATMEQLQGSRFDAVGRVSDQFRNEIQADEDRRAFEMMDRPIPVPPALQRRRPPSPELTVKKAEPEPVRRTRFERINDD